MQTEITSQSQSRALHRIAMGGVLFPLLIQIAFGLLILLPIMLVLVNVVHIDDASSQPLPDIALLLIAIVTLVIPAILVVWIAIPKSLFKKRKNAQLVANSISAFKPYRLHWLVSYIAATAVMICIIRILDMIGIRLPDQAVSISVVLCSTYLSNYYVAQRMLKKGDATLHMN